MGSERAGGTGASMVLAPSAVIDLSSGDRGGSLDAISLGKFTMEGRIDARALATAGLVPQNGGTVDLRSSETLAVA